MTQSGRGRGLPTVPAAPERPAIGHLQAGDTSPSHLALVAARGGYRTSTVDTRGAHTAWTVYSALLAALSHELWDGFTHNPQVGGWAARRLPVLWRDAWPGWPWWYVLQHVSTLAGGLVAVALFAYIGRHRLIRRWHGDPPYISARPARFWSGVGIGMGAFMITWPVLPYPYAPHVQGVRLIWAISAGLGLGAVVTRRRVDRRRTDVRL